jgi:hypothetical protein
VNLQQLDRIILKNIQWPNDFSEKRFCLWDISRKYNYSIVTVKNRWHAMVSSGFIVSLNVKPNNELFGLKRGLISIDNLYSISKEDMEFLKRKKFITNIYVMENWEVGIDFLYPKNSDPIQFIYDQIESKYKLKESQFVNIENNLNCTITRKDLLILQQLVRDPLLNAKEISAITNIKRTIVAKSLDKMSQGNAFSVDPIINIACVDNLIFAIYHAEVKRGDEAKVTRDACFLLKDNYLLTKYFPAKRVIILASFNSAEELEKFKEQMSSLDVVKQSLSVIFKTHPQSNYLYESLLQELIEKHSNYREDRELNLISEDDPLKSKNMEKGNSDII